MSQHASHNEPHVLPLPVYYAVFGALVVLTLITVGISMLDLGAHGWGTLGLALALMVAFVKAALVVGFFMHLRYDDKMYSVIFFSSVLFLILFFSLTFVDLMSRDHISELEGNFTLRKEQSYNAPSPAPAVDKAPAEHH